MILLILLTTFRIYTSGIKNMAIGWFVENKLPINEWEVAIVNTGSTNKLYRTFNPMKKLGLKLGLRSWVNQTTTIRIWVYKYRRPYD